MSGAGLVGGVGGVGCDVYYSAVTPQLGDTEWADG